MVRSHGIGANRIISLILDPYKIISKVLSNRIREVLQEVIDGNQFAFIKGREIVDSILMQMNVLKIIEEGSKMGLQLNWIWKKRMIKQVGIFWIMSWLEKVLRQVEILDVRMTIFSPLFEYHQWIP